MAMAGNNSDSTGSGSGILARVPDLIGWFSTPMGMQVQRIGSIALSLIIILILARAIAMVGWKQVMVALPMSLLFWLVYLASYLIQPVFDHLIYRHWWRFDWRGIAVFLKKRVLNEAVFSYSGETYLMAWVARTRGLEFDPDAPRPRILGRGDGPGLDPRTHPLAAIKDVNITSGLAGNLFTLLMLFLALAMGGAGILSQAMDPDTLRRLIVGFAILVMISLSILGFRNKVMSIPVRDNLFSGGMHMLRVSGQHLFFTLTWVIALPMVSVKAWILLGALRLVVGRLPLPNKEVLFAAIAVTLTGPMGGQVQALMAAQGAMHLVMHLGAWFAASAIEGSERGKG